MSATQATGVLTSYELPIGLKLNIDEAIYMLSPDDAPFLTGVGADGLSILGSEPVDQTTFHWQHDELLTPRADLAEQVTAGSTWITVASGDRIRFSTGDMVRVTGTNQTERLRITGYGTTAGSLLVTRGFASTTAEAHATGAKVIGLGTVLREGSDPEDARAQDRTTAFNHTQIYGPTAVEMTETEKVVSKYGVPNEQARQLMFRTIENGQSREFSFIYGWRHNDGTTKLRASGGLEYFIQSNVDTASTQLTVATIGARQKIAYNRGGLFTALVANPASLDDLNNTEDTQRVRQEVVDGRRGRQRVTVVTTEYGDLTVVRHRYVEPQDAFLIIREQVVRRILRGFTMERLAKTGDHEELQIVCEEGLEVKGEQHMARFKALSYSAT